MLEFWELSISSSGTAWSLPLSSHGTEMKIELWRGQMQYLISLLLHYILAAETGEENIIESACCSLAYNYIFP